MSRRPPDEAHGMSERETAIMDLVEKGASDNAAGTQLGVAPHYVRLVRRMYSGSWRENERFDHMVRAATAELGRRILATGRLHQ